MMEVGKKYQHSVFGTTYMCVGHTISKLPILEHLSHGNVFAERNEQSYIECKEPRSKTITLYLKEYYGHDGKPAGLFITELKNFAPHLAEKTITVTEGEGM